MHATSFNKPQTQRLALLNAQFDQNEIARRSEMPSTQDFDAHKKRLFQPAKDPVDYSIYEGDILFTPVENGRKRKREAYGQGQQPNVLSSLNGMYVDSTNYDRELARCGNDVKRAKRELFKQQYEVVGISLKNQVYESYKKAPLDNPVSVIGGVFHMPNLGSTAIRPMDIVVWDVPDDGKEMLADTTKFMPHTPSMRKLITERLDLSKTLSVDLIIEALKNDNIAECPEKQIKTRLLKIAEHVFKLTNTTDAAAKAQYIEDNKKELKDGLQHVIDAVVKSMEEAKTRIIGRCLRGAQPGERMDILVLR